MLSGTVSTITGDKPIEMTWSLASAGFLAQPRPCGCLIREIEVLNLLWGLLYCDAHKVQPGMEVWIDRLIIVLDKKFNRYSVLAILGEQNRVCPPIHNGVGLRAL